MTVHTLRKRKELQQPSGQVPSALIGMAMMFLRTFQIHHDEIHGIQRIGPCPLPRQPQAELELGLTEQRG